MVIADSNNISRQYMLQKIVLLELLLQHHLYLFTGKTSAQKSVQENNDFQTYVHWLKLNLARFLHFGLP